MKEVEDSKPSHLSSESGSWGETMNPYKITMNNIKPRKAIVWCQGLEEQLHLRKLQ